MNQWRAWSCGILLNKRLGVHALFFIIIARGKLFHSFAGLKMVGVRVWELGGLCV